MKSSEMSSEDLVDDLCEVMDDRSDLNEFRENMIQVNKHVKEMKDSDVVSELDIDAVKVMKIIQNLLTKISDETSEYQENLTEEEREMQNELFVRMSEEERNKMGRKCSKN